MYSANVGAGGRAGVTPSRSPGAIPIRANSSRAASSSAWLGGDIACAVSGTTAQQAGMKPSDHRVQGCRWVHDQQPFGGIRPEQDPVAGGEAAPVPDGGRQAQVPLGPGRAEHALLVGGDEC
jgi:hypothetical protein